MLISRNTNPRLLFLMLLPGLYLSDVIYGLLSQRLIEFVISPGIVIRGGVLVLAIISILFHANRFQLRWLISLFILFVLPIFGVIVSVSSNPAVATVLFEIQSLSKVLFGPTLVFLFVLLIKKWRVPPEMLVRYIDYTFYLLGVSLLFMQFLDIGQRTYGDYASGSKGIFGPQNDISLTLGLAFVASIYRNIVYPNLGRLVVMICSLFGFVGLGTRASLILGIITPCIVIFVLLFSRSPSWGRAQRLRLLFFIAPTFIIVAACAGYLSYTQLSEYDYQLAKYEALSSGAHPREQLLHAGFQHVENRSILVNIFGEGATNYQRGVYSNTEKLNEINMRMVEVDWMDLYGQYGFVFTVYLYSLISIFLIRTIWWWVLRRNPIDGIGAVMLGIYVLHSCLAGHALTSPIPSSLVAAIIATLLLYRYPKKRHF